MAIETFPWDVQHHLNSPEDCAAYLEAIFEDDPTPAEIARGLGDVAKSKGMSEISRATGLGRESLYKALSDDGNPTLTTLTAVAKAFGLRLAMVPIGADAPADTERHAA